MADGLREKDMTDDGSSFDPTFTPLNSMDLESQQLIGILSAAAEADDGSSDGAKKKQGSKRRLIEVGDDEDDSDVEITLPPAQATMRKQSTCGTGRALKSKKSMSQSTLDGGIGSFSKAGKSKTKTKSVQFIIRGGRKSSRPTQGNGKKNAVHAESSQPQKNKKKIQEEQL